MANYKTSLWTGAEGLRLSGIFPSITTAINSATIEFGAAQMGAGGLHALADAEEGLTDARKFLWAMLEQYYVAYTGGRNALLTNSSAAGGNKLLPTSPATWKDTGSGEGKTTKMTVSKSALSLIDEDSAKTTYTVVFNYDVAPPGSTNLEVEAE